MTPFWHLTCRPLWVAPNPLFCALSTRIANCFSHFRCPVISNHICIYINIHVQNVNTLYVHIYLVHISGFSPPKTWSVRVKISKHPLKHKWCTTNSRGNELSPLSWNWFLNRGNCICSKSVSFRHPSCGILSLRKMRNFQKRNSKRKSH